MLADARTWGADRTGSSCEMGTSNRCPLAPTTVVVSAARARTPPAEGCLAASGAMPWMKGWLVIAMLVMVGPWSSPLTGSVKFQ